MIKRIDTELVILVIGRILQIIILLIGFKISTKLLSPTEMGNLYLILSICSFFGFFFMNPVGQYINRKTHEWYENDNLLNKLYICSYYVFFISLLSIFIVYIVYFYGIGKEIELQLFIILIPLYIFFNTWNQIIIPMMNMLEKRLIFTLFTILTLIVSLLFSYYFVNYYHNTGIYWFMGQIVGFALVAILAFLYFLRKIDNNINLDIAHSWVKKSNFKVIMVFALPLAISVFFVWMQNQSYRIIIEKFIGAEFLGFLGVGIMIAIAIASSFETIVMQFLYPKMYQTMNDEILFQTTFSNIINLILPIYFFLAVYVSFLAKYLITVLVDHQYASSFIFIIFGIWMEFFRMSSSLLSTIAHAKMKTSVLVVPYALGGIVAFVGTYLGSMTLHYALLIPSLLVIAGGLTFITMFIQMKKMIFIDLHVKNFLLFLPYIGGLFLVFFAWQYAGDFLISLSIIGASGLWFLFGLYQFLKFRGIVS